MWRQVIPDEAVEAAAKGIWEARPMERVSDEGNPDYGAAKPWNEIKQYQRDRCMTLARFALTAAAPHLAAVGRAGRWDLLDRHKAAVSAVFQFEEQVVGDKNDLYQSRYAEGCNDMLAAIRATITHEMVSRECDHQCEGWQLRESDRVGTYCGACGCTAEPTVWHLSAETLEAMEASESKVPESHAIRAKELRRRFLGEGGK
jgi:hypothetical protein